MRGRFLLPLSCSRLLRCEYNASLTSFLAARSSLTPSNAPRNRTFSHKYLNNFAKAAPLGSMVALHMSNEVPLLVEFGFEAGHVRFYLAPKLSDEDD